MEAKYMKTSHSRARECKPFIHVFMIFILIENIYMILQIHESYVKSWASTIISKAQAPHQQVRHQMRVWGNGEEGMREWGDTL